MLSGPDGSGKSTLSNALFIKLESYGFNVSQKWLRFNHYTAKFVNLIGRISKKSYYEEYEWGSLGYHNYNGAIGYFYIFSVYLDHTFFTYFLKKRIFKKQNIYIIDRFIIDIMADLIVDTSKSEIIFFLFGPFLKKELNESNAFILTCDKDIVIKRRPDVIDDKSYLKKISAYKQIALRFDIGVLDTGSMSIDMLVSKLTKDLINK